MSSSSDAYGDTQTSDTQAHGQIAAKADELAKDSTLLAPQQTSTPLRTLAVIDGNSLMHRAFHAIMQPMKSPDGRSTNALLGFFNMFIKLVQRFHPDAIICAFDKGKPQVRIDMLPQYKAQRPPMDPDLHMQFPMVKDLLAHLGIPVCECAGWEGDDILGTLSKMAEEQHIHTLLFTGDRDIYQLASEYVSVVSTHKGMSDVAVMTPEDVDDLYHGITPALVPDFYGLKGDSSDNIPGVPGIGPKRAAQLITSYGDLEGVIAHADEVPGKMGESLRAHIEDARLSRRVATILRNAPVDIDISTLHFPDFDSKACAQAFAALGFNAALITKLLCLLPHMTRDEATALVRNAKKSATSAAFSSAAGLSAAVSGPSAAVAADVNAHNSAGQVSDSVSATLSLTTSAGKCASSQPVTAPLSQPSCLQLPQILENAQAEDYLLRVIEQKTWMACVFDDSGADAASALQEPSLDSLIAEDVYWFSDGRELMKLSGSRAQDMLLTLIRQGRVISHDLKALLHKVYPVNSHISAQLRVEELDPLRMVDTSVAAYLLDSDAASYELAQLLPRYTCWYFPNFVDDSELVEDSSRVASSSQAPEPELAPASASAKPALVPASAASPTAPTSQPAPVPDVAASLRTAYESVALAHLMPALLRALKETDVLTVFNTIEMPLLPVLLYMERMGMYADPKLLFEQSQVLDQEISSMMTQIFTDAHEQFNIDSPMQLSRILFETWKLPTKGLKKTKRGYYSTNAACLSRLGEHDSRVRRVLDYRERIKIKNTYLAALPHDILSDGRIHTTFNQTVAATGRLSSSEPNLQNIPTRSTLGHHVRKAFTLPDDHLFLACDYSQIELRLLAHLSGDEHLIRAFREGADFHTATAARIFGLDPSEVTPQLRSRAKAVNFGIVYGQQAFGLSTSLDISRASAQEMIDRYFEAYPKVKAYLDGLRTFARTHQFVTTMYGRKRYIAQINSKNFQLRSFAERTAMNHPVQGSAADIIKLAMIKVKERLDERRLRSKMILQIHDELDFEVLPSELDELSHLVKETMETVVDLSVPLIADVSYADNWADAK